MATQTGDWEELRKLARKLETEVDQKLVSFSKLGTSFGNRDHKHDSSDKIPLLNETNTDHVFDIMSKEIEILLEKLTDVNDKMSDYLDIQGKVAPSSGLSHILQRHRDILQDYSHDYRKTKSNIQSLLEREDLLGPSQGARKSSSGLTRRSDLYVKENEHLRNSDRLVDEQISIALETRDHLLNQKAVFKAIQTKVNTLATRFPLINSVVQRINLRKRRDSIILGLVIGVCLILVLVYAWH